MFQYSKREGTRAASFDGQVLSEVKEKRSQKVIELSNKIVEEYNKGYIGEKIKVLVEEKEEKIYKGHSKNYINVIIKEAKEDIRNRIVDVLIEKQESGKLIGKLTFL